MFNHRQQAPSLRPNPNPKNKLVAKITRKPLFLSGFLLAMVWPISQLVMEPGVWGEPAQVVEVSAADIKAGVGITAFANDSLADMILDGDTLNPDEDSLLIADFDFEFTSLDASCIQVIYDGKVYQQRWDTLTQIQFWRRIMGLSKDSCLISRSSDRKILGAIPSYVWGRMSDRRQSVYKDSVRKANDLSPNSGIYVTAGKAHYYHFDRVLYQITGSIRVFEELGVDPWFAQAILLIESPGQMNRSPVGAYGPFQLMPEVATEFGLIVSDSLDERESLTLSASAAAKLIKRRCVPYTRHMLSKRNIPYSEDDVFFRMLVLHCYHAGAGNVEAVLAKMGADKGGMDLMQEVWRTEAGGFRNASQNYSQLALAAFMELDLLMMSLPEDVCHEKQEVFAAVASEDSIPTAAP